MCGVVVYFGDCGNNLTRVLTAISAITYRAPDSTGVGYFGDDTAPLRTRRSLGAITALVETLLSEPAYPNPPKSLFDFWTPKDKDPEEAQRRLLRLEGLPIEGPSTIQGGHGTYLSYEDLVDPERPVKISPGRPGRPGPLPEIQIRSRKHFQRIIQDLIHEYDLSPIVVQAILRKALSRALARDQEQGAIQADPAEILGAFDRLFDTAHLGEKSPRPQRIYTNGQIVAPYAEKFLWQYLVKLRIVIPPDYDRDGVRCLFRLLDAALLSRLSCSPGLDDAVQQTLERIWPEGSFTRNAGGWRTLYWAEKGVNVYGRAGAAVLSHLLDHEIIPQHLSVDPTRDLDAFSDNTGQTTASALRYLSSPILSQGRWALQAPVTLKNAHPFFDSRKQRIIVLNGQFSGDVEEKLEMFLQKVAGYEFRSANSSEYFALLWGYYFDVLRGEKDRYEAVLSQIDQELEEFGIGSRSIDYEIYRRLHNKTQADLDAIAFVEAARCVSREGGQVAAAGISVASPRTLYVASHNRPVFVAQRVGTEEFMVVSDINAAMGLFPQRIIREKVLQLHALRKGHLSRSASIRDEGGSRDRILLEKRQYDDEERRLLEEFRIRVHPLEGDEIFAKIQAFPTGDGSFRKLTIADFDGNPLPTIEPFDTLLNPLQTGKDVNRSFYEAHLEETPERLENILQFHIPESETIPEFDFRESLLRRRFGKGLSSLNRIVLLGMGSSHHAGIMARRFIQKALPGVDVVSLRPAEIEDMRRTIIPEKDLVLLLSWSGTTADIVRTAKDLSEMNVALIGVTEKVFSDMGLITSRSVGVLPILSGEEVTVPGLKSVLCMLFNISLFSLWLSSKVFPQGNTKVLMEGLQSIPDLLSAVLQDKESLQFSHDLSLEASQSRSATVIDALYTTGVGREAAFKLEETSWNAIGRCLDYREVAIESFKGNSRRNLILVNTTNRARLLEALELMEAMSSEGIYFSGVSFTGRHQARMEEACHGRLAILPKVDDELQPFLDLIFYYRFAFLYGLAHGRRAEDFPRNRAKSITAGRSTSKKRLTPAAEIMEMASREIAACDEAHDLTQGLKQESVWEQEARTSRERAYYRGMRGLALAIQEGCSLKNSFLESFSGDPKALSNTFFKQVPDDGEMLLIPLDRAAHSTARTLSVHWSRLLGCTPRVTMPEDLQAHFPKDIVSVFMACQAPDEELLKKLLENASSPCFFCGPTMDESAARFFASSLGYGLIKDTFGHCMEEALFASLFSIFISVWKLNNSQRADIAEKHFRECGQAVGAVLNCLPLKQSISRAMQENVDYSTAFFIGPPGGTGATFARRFEACPSLTMESYLFGESVHGPLVTVDSNVDEKFVQIEARRQMVEEYGETRVSVWESEYLGGNTTDSFLSGPPKFIPLSQRSPFYAEGAWYLPELKPSYNPDNDNLIIFDTTSERFINQILDEMSTYGCRYPRAVLISQEALETRPERRNLFRYPISHILRLPALWTEGSARALPEISLPLVLSLLCVAMMNDRGL